MHNMHAQYACMHNMHAQYACTICMHNIYSRYLHMLRPGFSGNNWLLQWLKRNGFILRAGSVYLTESGELACSQYVCSPRMGMYRTGDMSTSHFYARDLHVWLPDKMYDGMRIVCPSCNSPHDVKAHGWTKLRK